MNKKFTDAFGNDCEWYARNPTACQNAQMAKNRDGTSANEACQACESGGTLVVAGFLEAEIEIEPASDLPIGCPLGSCTSDQDCASDVCPEAKCKDGVCACGSGCESFGKTCRPSEEAFEIPLPTYREHMESNTATWVWVLAVVVVLTVLAGALIATSSTPKKVARARTQMCFG